MSTFLFASTIFGPVKSRRLGVSLGINLLPSDAKFCNFDCVYCECGWNPDYTTSSITLPKKEQVINELECVLKTMQEEEKSLDAITFAGNGEPTMHPDFDTIIDQVIELRNRFFPQAKLSVLSNATMLHKLRVIEALKKVDLNIQKVDSALIETIRKVNNPPAGFTIEKLMKNLQQFGNNLVVQTMFLKGKIQNELLDNTSDIEVNAWLKFLSILKPNKVMIYSLDRDTPSEDLQKISPEKLQEIGRKVADLGLKIEVST